MIRFDCNGVIVDNPRVCQLGQIFPCTLQEKLCWIRKMIHTILDGLDGLYHQAKFGEIRTSRAGCRCDSSTSGFSPCLGRLVVPIHVKLGVADGHLGPLGCAKFYLNL